jgi:hypothetical protein
VQGTMQDGTTARLAGSGIMWTSSNRAVAAVLLGTVIGVTPGTTVITAKVGNVEGQAQVVVQARAPAPAQPPAPAAP